MSSAEKLSWSNGPEIQTRRCGCIRFATWGQHRWEVHRVYERSLISGRNVVMAQLYLDGKRIGGNYDGFVQAVARADALRAALGAGA